MTTESLANPFVYASLICSASFWLSLILSLIPGARGLNFPGIWWLAILGVGVAFGVIAAVLNFEKRLWIAAVGLGLVTLLFVIYVIGS